MNDVSALTRAPFSEEIFQEELERLTAMFPDRRLSRVPADVAETIHPYDTRRPVEGYGLRLAARFTRTDPSRYGLFRFVRELDDRLLREDLGDWFGYAPFTPSQVTELIRINLAVESQTHGGDLSRGSVLAKLVQFQREHMFRPAPTAEIPTLEDIARVQEFQVQFAQQGVFPAPHIIWLMTRFLPDGFISPKDYIDLFSTTEEQVRSAEAYVMGCTTLDEVRSYDSLPQFIKDEMAEQPALRLPL